MKVSLVVLLLGEVLKGAIACSFTGPDSFVESHESPNNITVAPDVTPYGARSCYLTPALNSSSDRAVLHGLNYIPLFMSGDVGNLPPDHLLLQNLRTTLIMIGDSTDREMVLAWCRTMAKARPELVKPWLRNSTTGRLISAGCTIPYDDARRSFSVANMHIFGTPLSRMKGFFRRGHLYAGNDSTSTPERIASVARPHVVTPALSLGSDEDPSFVTLHSCLWDVTGHLTGVPFSSNELRVYSEGIVAAAEAVRRTFPSSAFRFETCKEVNIAASNYSRSDILTVTRNQGLALDRTAQSTFLSNQSLNRWDDGRGEPGAGRQLVDGVIDARAVLAGYESEATDGLHYKGKAAVMLFNSILNEFFGM